MFRRVLVMLFSIVLVGAIWAVRPMINRKQFRWSALRRPRQR